MMAFQRETQMLEQLNKLKAQFGLAGIKAEFEAEGSGFNDLVRLRRVTARAGVELHVKIGGVEAIRDIMDCAELGVDGMIAPMVESPFGAKKFVESIKSLGLLNHFHYSINVETKAAVEQLDAILEAISGVVSNITIGRTDLSGSYLDETIKPNTSFITETVKTIATKARNAGFTATMGGSLNADTVKIYQDRQDVACLLHRMESRKVILPTATLLQNPDSLKEALHFEELYILSKKEFLDMRVASEMKRLTNLKTRS